MSSMAAKLCSHIADGARLQCITRRFGASEGGGHFLAANLQATSIFGEEILANICLQRSSSVDGGPDSFSGHLRLRSKTQSIAVTLGEKLSSLIASLTVVSK